MRPRPIDPRTQPKIRLRSTFGPPRPIFSAILASPEPHVHNDLRQREAAVSSPNRFFPILFETSNVPSQRGSLYETAHY